jgi:polysaccharide biosynthesis protein PslH
VNIRTYNVLRLLSQRYEIDALCFYRRGLAGSVERSLAGLRPLVRTVQAFPIEQEGSRRRWLRDHLTSTLSRTVYTRHVYEHAAVRARLRELLAQREYALVHVDSLDLSAYLPEFGQLPVVCVHHNVESQLLRRRARLETHPARRAYLDFQGRLMAKEEAAWAPRVALNVTCSSDDAATLADIAPGTRVTVVPNGVDVHTFQPAEQPPGGVVFVGGMTWFPNRDALEHFATDIMPRLQRAGAAPPVHWVGRASPGATERYAKAGISLTGYVDDVRAWVHGARCYVVPLRVGGGTRLKVLDAWAMGKAVVSTAVGCEGLDARDGENILVRDDPEEFAEAVRLVLSDDALRDRLAANARATAEQTYAWERIGAHMFEQYAAIERPSRVPPTVTTR